MNQWYSLVEDEETAPAGPSTKCLTSLLSCYESESDGEPEEFPGKCSFNIRFSSRLIRGACSLDFTRSETTTFRREKSAVSGVCT